MYCCPSIFLKCAIDIHDTHTPFMISCRNHKPPMKSLKLKKNTKPNRYGEKIIQIGPVRKKLLLLDSRVEEEYEIEKNCKYWKVPEIEENVWKDEF